MPHIRRINPGEALLYREVRLAALAEAPHAFGSTHEEASQRSLESWQEQSEITAIGSDRATFFALDQDSPIGLAAIYRNQNAPDVGDLIQVWLSPEFRKTGIAQQLIKALLTWASENQFMKIRAQVSSTNKEGIPFYERLGFTESHPIDGDQTFELELPPKKTNCQGTVSS